MIDDMVTVKNFIGGGENLDLDIYFSFDCDSTPYVTRTVIKGGPGTANKTSLMGISTEWDVVVGVSDAQKVRCHKPDCNNAIKWKIVFSVHLYLDVHLSITAFIWSLIASGEKEGRRDAGSNDVTTYSKCICCDKKAVIEEKPSTGKQAPETGEN